QEVWARAGLRLPPGTPILGMEDPWRYRVRGEFEAFYRHLEGAAAGRELVLGFHRMRSHRVVPIEECPIHHQRIERGLLAFRSAARRLAVRGMVNLHLTAEPEGPGLLWRVRYQRREDGAQTPALIAAVQETLPDVVLLDSSMRYDVLGLQFRVRSDTFIQTNHRQTPVLYGAALEMLGATREDRVLDLFCGIGTMSLAAARQAGSALGIEENPQAVRLAELAARINEVPNARFFAGRVEDKLADVRVGACDLALLDPPRAGVEPAALAQLLRLGPRRIVYVSCEASTQARDVARLLAGGYRLRRAALVDMFPHTYHVESIALLERA
ncbi:MAG: class I SAM-dependent RNA methyltransferase, partial [Candidatus Dormibacteraceae bacterium]